MPPTILRYISAGSSKAGAILTILSIPPEKVARMTDITIPINALNISPSCLAWYAIPGLPAPIFCDITAIIPDDITPNIIIKTPIYVFAVPTAPTAWSLTDDSISVSTIPENI